MPDSDPTELEKTALAALKSTDVREGIRHLSKAFSLFSKETTKLKTAYQKLEEEFYEINCKLEKKNLELKEKNKQLKGVSGYLNNILSNISQGILFIDLSGVITTYNESAGKILEKNPKDLLFKRFWNHFPDKFFGFSMKDALDFGLSKRIHYLNREKKEIEVLASFVFEGPKLHQGIAIVLRDITEIQRLSDLASRCDRMRELGEMAATVAHEIRNPLGGIRGYATLLHRDLKNDPAAQEMTGHIIEGTKSLERLVSTILHYTRPLSPNIELVDLIDLIHSLKNSLLVDTSFSKKIKIELHLSESKYLIPIDRQLVNSAFLNLLVNAYQAMGETGTITISMIKQDHGCLINISDTGKGINDQDLKHIFSPFFTTKQKGNGLGLSETHKIIQAHFGNMEVHSKLGSGTSFTIFLPIKKGK